MAKFKENDLVILKDCATVTKALGVYRVVDYLQHDVVVVSAFDSDKFSRAVKEDALKLVGNLNGLDELVCVEKVPDIINTDAMTSKDVDYESIVKTPVYYDFINVGEALNKLKSYEHYTTKHIEDIKFVVDYVGCRILPILVKSMEYSGTSLTKVTYMAADLTIHRYVPSLSTLKIFDTFLEASKSLIASGYDPEKDEPELPF